MKTIKAVHISGKRWFQKLYGNTYHTVKIEVAFEDGTRELLSSPRTYGYGEMWNQTALTMLIDGGYAVQEYYPAPHDKQPKYYYATAYCRDKGITCFTDVSDVPRQRDL